MMGFEFDRFTSDVNEGLLCSICRDVLEDPVQAPCEHAFCRLCIEGWLVQENTCPEDRLPLSVSRLRPLFRYMRNDLNRLRIRCRNQEHGCNYESDLEFIRSHEENCPFEMIKCPNELCTRFICKGNLSSHVQTCEFRYKDCPNGCGLMIMGPNDEEHSCIGELRTAIEVLRSEMTCKYDEQKREMDLRLDMQRGHMVQKEAALQAQVDELKSENFRLAQNLKMFMDIELQRRQEMEMLEIEKKELIELLKGFRNTQNEKKEKTRRTLCRSCSFHGKVTPV